MQYNLQIKPFQKQDGYKYKVLQITDIALHSSEKRSTKSISKKIEYAFKSKKPDRIYNSDTKIQTDISRKKITLINSIKQDPEFIEYVQREEKNGCKICISIRQKKFSIFSI